jgi:hypothetical protein
METKGDMPKPGYRALVISTSIVIAFLGANPFADAVGFPRQDQDNGFPMAATMRIVCGIVVCFASLSFLNFLIRLVRDLVDRLGSSSARPDWRLALTSILCGTICLLAALQGAFAATQSAGVSVTPAMTFSAGPGNPGGSIDMEARNRAPIALTLVSLLTFLAGAGLLAFGVWGSLKPAASQATAAKPEGWGEPMIDAARA